MYYPDLAPMDKETNYWVSKDASYIGWLEPSEEEPIFGETSEEFKECIQEICKGEQFLEASHRGFHICPLCKEGDKKGVSARTFLIPSSEEDKFYYFPGMVHHYVLEHNYQPPEEFISAVMALDLKSKKSSLSQRRKKQKMQQNVRNVLNKLARKQNTSR